MLAIPVVALLLAGGYWWMSQEEEPDSGANDPCASFREELLGVQTQEFENSREERRAVAEIRGRASDAGCDSDDLRSET